MTAEKPPPGTIPTLTEVVPWPGIPPQASPVVAGATPPVPAQTEVVSKSPASPAALPPMPPAQAPEGGGASVTEAQLAQRVLADVQKQVDLMLEVRLREALAPILARAGDALVRDARKELTTALRDVVARAVAKELGRDDKT